MFDLLITVLPLIQVVVDPIAVGEGADARYFLDPIHTMALRNRSPRDDTVTHEMVHAYNDFFVPAISKRIRRDEGMAYGIGALLDLPITSGQRLEQYINKASRCPDPDIIAGLWKNLWRKFGTPSGLGGGFEQGKAFSFDSTDFQNVRQHLALHVSCQEFSVVINRLLKKRVCSRICG